MSKRAIKFLTLSLFIFITLLSLSFVSILAQNDPPAQTLEVSPPSQEIAADPGKTVQIRAKVRNSGRNTIPMKVRIEDFTAAGEEGQVALVEKGPYSISSWTTLSPESFTLAPGEEKDVTATVVVPAAGSAGGRYGSFVFSSVSETDNPNTASVGQEIASLFLLRISGPVKENVRLESFKAPVFSEFGPIPFELKFANAGNVHTKVFGIINVSNMFGQKVADIVVPGTNIFPGASRILEASLPNKFLFGNYTATALMYYGSKNESITQTAHFTAVPVRVVALGVALLALLFVLRKRLGKAFKALTK